ncbi:MAG: Autoinducer 2 sensor kinase/phosphatase LuxQ [candidate division WS6 bacterium OLB20]|uniref:Autoinducer 2 sensor kinase/phosphatase LuxQ n=1 Tax=candidate division WS6 bacterium OLB20 TaxID=1617426 RepID=A0A136M0G6_9BACT|nr:MAG: Autoinducer 2 sensor kinase/phosphatase LuxQ [candidate division WS6 bacterium OLB20]
MTGFLRNRGSLLIAAIAAVAVAGILIFAGWVNATQSEALSVFASALQQRQAVLTGSTVATLIDPAGDTDTLQAELVSVQSRFPEVASLAVLLPEQGKFRVIASTESDDIGTVVSNDQYSRAYSEEQTITFQRQTQSRDASGQEQKSIRIIPVIPVKASDGTVISLLEIGFDTSEVSALVSVISSNSIVFINLFAVFTAGLILLAAAAVIQRRTGETHTREQLEHKDELLASAAHDLGGPLIGIRLDVEELQALLPDNQDAQRLLKEIHDTVQYESNFLQDLLIVSRFERGKEQVFPRPVFLQETFSRLIEDYKPRAQEKGLQLELTTPVDNLPKVIADPDKIGEVFMNYLSNAIKYSDKGTVSVAVEVKSPARNHLSLLRSRTRE